VHAYTDNGLIATTASVLFPFAIGVSACKRVAAWRAALLPDRPTFRRVRDQRAMA